MTGSIFELDFIGDIHGQATTLLALLNRLGWKQRNGRLVGPGGRKLVFVGDLIDRGPENLRTVDVVRTLVEQGEALCLMGNHEYNAVQFHSEDPENPGERLRPHSEKNVKQHRAVLKELEDRPADRDDMIAWFRSLPLAVEEPDWRCVHACWHERSLEVLHKSGNGWYLTEDAWLRSGRKGSPVDRAVETLLKGPEFELPDGAQFHDKEGNPRRHARIAWWKPAPSSLEDALLFQTPPAGLDPSAAYDNPDHPGYAKAAPPVFFGHYWKRGEVRAERPNAACLDYSIGKGDRLVAYRFRGERELRPDRFVVQPLVNEVSP